jgi:hypothetical protein
MAKAAAIPNNVGRSFIWALMGSTSLSTDDIEQGAFPGDGADPGQLRHQPLIGVSGRVLLVLLHSIEQEPINHPVAG